MTLAPAVGWTASYFERFRIGVSLDELETDILKSLDDYIIKVLFFYFFKGCHTTSDKS